MSIRDEYRPNPAHRDGRPGKSQCTVPESDEKLCFRHILRRKWHNLKDGGKYGWGILWDTDPDTDVKTLRVLGLTESRTESKIARFETLRVYEDDHREWHGYSINLRKQSDRPAAKVLKAWCDMSIISKKDARNSLNQLHVILADRINIYSFADDYFRDQSSKRIGYRYIASRYNYVGDRTKYDDSTEIDDYGTYDTGVTDDESADFSF